MQSCSSFVINSFGDPIYLRKFGKKTALGGAQDTAIALRLSKDEIDLVHPLPFRKFSPKIFVHLLCGRMCGAKFSSEPGFRYDNLF